MFSEEFSDDEVHKSDHDDKTSTTPPPNPSTKSYCVEGGEKSVVVPDGKRKESERLEVKKKLGDHKMETKKKKKKRKDNRLKVLERIQKEKAARAERDAMLSNQKVHPVQNSCLLTLHTLTD